MVWRTQNLVLMADVRTSARRMTRPRLHHCSSLATRDQVTEANTTICTPACSHTASQMTTDDEYRTCTVITPYEGLQNQAARMLRRSVDRSALGAGRSSFPG